MAAATEIVIPVSVMLTLLLAVVVALYFQYRHKRLVMEVIRLTVERNEKVDPVLVEAIARGPRRTGQDLRRGFILLALALAVVAFGYTFGVLTRGDLGLAVMGLAAFPGCVGLAYLGLHLLERRQA